MSLLNVTSLELLEGRAPASPKSGVAGAPPSITHGTLRRGWIFYDGQCRYCRAAANRFASIFAGRGFEFVTLQTPWVQRRLNLDPDAPLEEMRVLTVKGQDLGGANAVIYLARQIWWARPLSWLARIPAFHKLIDHSYRWIAVRRRCTHLAGRDALCGVPLISGTRRSSSLHRRIRPCLGLILLPIAALILRPHVTPWIFMWSMAGALFFAFKWLTFCKAKDARRDLQLRRWPGYFFFWAGLDAAEFLGTKTNPVRGVVAARLSAFALTKIAFGALLLFGLARHFSNPLLAGWIGMIGIIFILHFGLFDLAAVVWRWNGVNAKPIMNAPLKATSLTEFWGRRWNGAFNQLVLVVLFRPLARSVGTIRATFAAFLFSGLLHELVISLPAGAGYGLPSSYFLLQAWGLVAQRSSLGKRWQLSGGWRGWLFTVSLTAGPAFWLFHPPFAQRVIVPFLQTIGAL